jgi:RHS repeat-associated protein
MRKWVMILAAALLAPGVYAVEPVRHSDPNMPGLPGQTDEYWAKLREEQRAAKKAAQQQAVVNEESVCFYTGKPFDADLGYVIKYRNYNPEMMRWTTADPSGFRDGPNNYKYTSCPSYVIDIDGLAEVKIINGTGIYKIVWLEELHIGFGSASAGASLPLGVSVSIDFGWEWELAGAVIAYLDSGNMPQHTSPPIGFSWRDDAWLRNFVVNPAEYSEIDWGEGSQTSLGRRYGVMEVIINWSRIAVE